MGAQVNNKKEIIIHQYTMANQVYNKEIIIDKYTMGAQVNNSTREELSQSIVRN